MDAIDPGCIPDETVTVTVAEAAKLPGLLGRIAPIMLARRGEYGYTDVATGRRILLVAAPDITA